MSVELFLTKETSPDGFEPPTFRLTAERANPLRHRDTAALLLPAIAQLESICNKAVKEEQEVAVNVHLDFLRCTTVLKFT